MKKKSIYGALCVILLVIIIIVLNQAFQSETSRIEAAEFKREIEQLGRKLRKLRLQIDSDQKLGDYLEEKVFYYLNSEIEIEGNEYHAPVLLFCITTDCLSQSSLHNTDISTMKSWSFDLDDIESREKALYNAITAIVLDYPRIYNLRIISLGLHGQILSDDFWRIRPINDETF